MKIKKMELNKFKRFTHLRVDGLPQTAKLVILVGPNGSGKTSFMESMNHYYKFSGFGNPGDIGYLYKTGGMEIDQQVYQQWYDHAREMVNIEFYDEEFSKEGVDNNLKGHFYFRSAYRNEPNFQMDYMQRQNNPIEMIRLDTLIENDQTVSNNYQRLVADTVSGVYENDDREKLVDTLRNELTGTIEKAIERVFDDLTFTSIGQPLINGNFYFTKGTTKNFCYRNLSAGEKAAFDLILDIVVQSKYYPDAIYCIDEPEAHMHTKLQGKVLRELYKLIPGNSQLWISTHSIGMLHEAEQIERETPGTVVFLDFGERDFDQEQIIKPTIIGRALIEKFYELAFGDFAKLMLPQTIVFCEGDSNGVGRKNYDKSIYSRIFSGTHPEALFISAGSCNDIEKIELTHGDMIKTLLNGTNIIKVVDRDNRSEEEIVELRNKGVKVLSRRNLESYLLDDVIIQRLCQKYGKTEEYENCIYDKNEAISNSIKRGNPENDIKSAKGDIYNALKKRLSLTACGNTADAFIRDTLAPLFTSELVLYKELEADVFG